MHNCLFLRSLPYPSPIVAVSEVSEGCGNLNWEGYRSSHTCGARTGVKSTYERHRRSRTDGEMARKGGGRGYQALAFGISYNAITHLCRSGRRVTIPIRIGVPLQRVSG